MALLHHQGKVFLSFFKQAGKSDHLLVYLISAKNNNNVIELLHVQFIKIKNHSADIHMLRLHRITKRRLHSASVSVSEASRLKGSHVVCIRV